MLFRRGCLEGKVARGLFRRGCQGGRDSLEESSLEELFSAEGCISRKEIIPGRAFSCRGMIIAEGNHPCRTFFLQRDAFCRRKSSLEELFSAEGCILQKKIIPEGTFPAEG